MGSWDPAASRQMPLGMRVELRDLEEEAARRVTAGEEWVVPKARRRGTGPRPRLFPWPEGVVLGPVPAYISKNQHFLFHLIQSYYILFLLFWG